MSFEISEEEELLSFCHAFNYHNLMVVFKAKGWTKIDHFFDNEKAFFMPSFCSSSLMKINDKIVFKEQLKQYYQELIENVSSKNTLLTNRIKNKYKSHATNLSIMGLWPGKRKQVRTKKIIENIKKKLKVSNFNYESKQSSIQQLFQQIYGTDHADSEDHIDTQIDPIDHMDNPIDPIDHMDNPIDPIDHMDNPIDPIDHMDNPIDPIDHMDNPIDPIDHIDNPIDPIDHMDNPIDPIDHIDNPIDPIDSINISIDSIRKPRKPRKTRIDSRKNQVVTRKKKSKKK
ncbi:hypothetical protein BLOT_008205 [Blomia tropicalis]|nr:hypothetical protein BLOT_008205 [Blomia tropicalis]